MTSIQAIFTCVVAVFLVSCGNFYTSFSDHGVPKSSSDTIRDTITIPSDSLILNPLFTNNDTLWSAQDTLRAFSEARLRWHTTLPAQSDSIILYGIIRCTDTLELTTIYNWPYRTPIATDIKYNLDSSSLDHFFSLTIHQQTSMDLRIQLLRESVDPYVLNARVLVGYESGQAEFQTISSDIELSEVMAISEYSSLAVSPQTHFWDSVRIAASDSIIGYVSGDSLNTHVMERHELMRFQLDGSIQNSLWSNASNPDTLRQLFAGDEGWIYILYSNLSDTTQVLNAYMERKKILSLRTPQHSE